MRLTDYLRAALQWCVKFPVELALMLLGLPIVPIALLFRIVHEETTQAFTQYPGTWKLVTLPRWAWLWSNDRDGAWGDTRGWWDANAAFKGGCSAFANMFWWLAVRNPANNTRFLDWFACNVAAPGLVLTYTGDRDVKDHVGMGGLQFVRAQLGDRRWYGLYFVHEYKRWPGRGMVIRLGFKIEPSDAEKDWSADPQKAWIGMTYRVAPFKDIS